MAGKENNGTEKLHFEFLVRKFLGGTLDHYGNELAETHGRLNSFFFDRIFGRIAIAPEKIEKLKRFAEKGRLIYAIPYRSPLDFLFLNVRLRYAGLPMPEIAYNTLLYRFQPVRKLLKIFLARLIYVLNFGTWPDPFRNKYYLKRFREGAGFVVSLEDPPSFQKRLANPWHDPLYRLVKLHKKQKENIIVIPVFLVFAKGPQKEEKGFWDIFTGPRDRPGRLRKIVHYLRYYQQAFLEVGDPITIDMFRERPDQQGKTDVEVAFRLRQELWEHSTREQKVIRGPVLKPRTQIMETVLRDPMLQKTIRQQSKDRGKPYRAVRKEAAGYVDEIAAAYSQSTIEFLDMALSWVWSNLYSGVNIDDEGLARVREAAKRFPVVYVPSHKSHIDYLVLSWALYHRNLVSPHIAAGINLNTWPIGTIFRKAGAFFLRRSFRGNRLYAEVFAKYVEVLVREGYNLEFFIEGGRSRTGRLLLPKLGLVKYVMEAFKNGAAKDVMFVPVYIGYEQILEEGEYLEEMHGVKNPKSNLVELLRNRKLISKRYGRIYINFGEPISLKEHLETRERETTLTAAIPPDEQSESEQGQVTLDLALRLIQGINRNQVVTAFSLMAAALLTSPAKAISRTQLLNALFLFYQYLVAVGARFASTLENFQKAMDEVIAYYQERDLLVIEEGEDTEEPIYTLPEEQRLSLEMYKNMILHHFLPMNFVTLSLLSADYGECHLAKVFEDYRFLKDLFQLEFIHDELATDEEKISACLRFLENGRQLLMAEEDGMKMCKVTPKGREEMVYFSAMLTNFLEAYGIVLNALPSLQAHPETEKEFLQRLRRTGQRLYKQGQVLRPEALSQLLFQNALLLAKQRGIIKSEPGDGKFPLLALTPQTDELRNQLLTHISKFIRVEKYHYLGQ